MKSSSPKYLSCVSLSKILSYNKVVLKLKVILFFKEDFCRFKKKEAMANEMSQWQMPKFTKDNYENWCISMKAILGANDVWEIVEKGLEVPEDEANLNQVQKDLLQAQRKKDQKAIMIIHQCLDDL